MTSIENILLKVKYDDVMLLKDKIEAFVAYFETEDTIIIELKTAILEALATNGYNEVTTNYLDSLLQDFPKDKFKIYNNLFNGLLEYNHDSDLAICMEEIASLEIKTYDDKAYHELIKENYNYYLQSKHEA